MQARAIDEVLATPPPTGHRAHRSPYGYTPTEWICILYIALFSTTTVLHLIQALYKRPRLYWVLPTIMTCGICEIIGWGARLWSSRSVLNINAFLMQITTTIIAPTFLTAGLYTILGDMIRTLGSQYSRITPKAYLITFITADVIALVIQAIGGAKASFAFQNGRDPNPGGHIMLGGIIFQLVGILLYSALATEFLLRFHLQKPLQKMNKNVLEGRGIVGKGVSLVAIGMAIATLFVLIRSVYRTIELINGWTGRIITTEKYFNILDGAPIVLAMIALNIAHPRLL
ncbi:RTA1-domain-containing protein [Hysterangium stoloniferum]|nr:RTA1-domain-containing protein [Hysterangium stoloniferum]